MQPEEAEVINNRYIPYSIRQVLDNNDDLKYLFQRSIHHNQSQGSLISMNVNSGRETMMKTPVESMLPPRYQKPVSMTPVPPLKTTLPVRKNPNKEKTYFQIKKE